ncbi:hypothetical protein [Mesorhizobium sp. M0195]|uniref:hypothetical protein n=1 Tax=Mesorhizobium sp. M0195 TaxID=2956910 RepID=UPI00333D8A08
MSALGPQTGIGSGTPALLDAFFLSRPRSRPRSFNHLIGVVGRLFEWMVEHDCIDIALLSR